MGKAFTKAEREGRSSDSGEEIECYIGSNGAASPNDAKVSRCKIKYIKLKLLKHRRQVKSERSVEF